MDTKTPAERLADKLKAEQNEVRLLASLAIFIFGRKTDELKPEVMTSYTPEEAVKAADKIIKEIEK